MLLTLNKVVGSFLLLASASQISYAALCEQNGDNGIAGALIILQLEPQILENILAYLKKPDALSLRLVDHHLNGLMKKSKYWEKNLRDLIADDVFQAILLRDPYLLKKLERSTTLPKEVFWFDMLVTLIKLKKFSENESDIRYITEKFDTGSVMTNIGDIFLAVSNTV